MWEHGVRQTFLTNPIIGMWNEDIFDSDFVEIFVTGGLISFVPFIYLLKTVYGTIRKIKRSGKGHETILIHYYGALAIFVAGVSAAGSGATLFTPKSGPIFFSLLVFFLKMYEIYFVKLYPTITVRTDEMYFKGPSYYYFNRKDH